MKLLIFIVACCSGIETLGQTDGQDTIDYVHGLPVTGEGTIPENDNDMQEEFLEKIPKLTKAINRNATR